MVNKVPLTSQVNLKLYDRSFKNLTAREKVDIKMLMVHVIKTYHRDDNFSDTTSSIQTGRLKKKKKLKIPSSNFILSTAVIYCLFVSCVHWHDRIDHKRHLYFFINLLQLIANSDFDKRSKRTIKLRIRHKGTHNLFCVMTINGK